MFQLVDGVSVQARWFAGRLRDSLTGSCPLGQCVLAQTFPRPLRMTVERLALQASVQLNITSISDMDSAIEGDLRRGSLALWAYCTPLQPARSCSGPCCDVESCAVDTGTRPDHRTSWHHHHCITSCTSPSCLCPHRCDVRWADSFECASPCSATVKASMLAALKRRKGWVGGVGHLTDRAMG